MITKLDQACENLTPVEATDHLGVQHKLWTVTDTTVVSEVAQLMEDKPMFVADGHHRYETASNYKAQLDQELGGL